MYRWLWSVAILLAIPAVAAAQDLSRSELPRMSLEGEFEGRYREAGLPLSLAAPEPREEGEKSSRFSLGPAVGFLNAHNSDHGTWSAGVQARLRIIQILAVEASVTFHENEYENGDAKVIQYPVQVTGLLYILPVGPIHPYLLAGVGWYYTTVEYSGTFGAFPNSTSNDFGGHLGLGTDLMLGSAVSLNVDVRYIFLNPSSEQIKDADFNYFQVTFGLNFFF